MNIINLKEEPELLNTLAEWHHNEWSHISPQNSLQMRIEKMHLHLYQEFFPSTFVIKEKEQLMGSAAIVKHDMNTRMELSPWLASVFVSQESRNKGAGSKIVLHVMKKAKAAGVKSFYLYTPNKEKFYEKLGWSIFCKEVYRGQQVTIMHVLLNR